MAAEKKFENKIKKFLQDKGCWLIKYWAGAPYTKSGVPDLIINCCGYFIAVEVKAADGEPSALQLYNLKKIDKSGGFAILLYPNHWQLFQNFIDCLMEDDMNNARFNYEILKRVWSEGKWINGN